MAKDSIALSVIIPVYNAERTIRKALDSLLQQSLEEIEIICVDDGSLDSSVQIITEYAEKDGRVRLLRQQNRYAGIARNTGMDASRGEYLFFLDSDDYVMNYALEAALDKCKRYNLDCLRFRSYTLDEQTGRYVCNDRNDFSNLQDRDYNRLLRLEADGPLLKISVAPWSGMYRRAFLTEHGCRFNGLQCVNDRSFFNRVITAGGRYMCARDRVTVHRINQSDSLVGQKAGHFDCQVESVRITEKELKTGHASPETAELIMRQEYLDLLVWYGQYMSDSDRRKEMDRKIQEYLEDPASEHAALLREMMDQLNPEIFLPAAAKESAPMHDVCETPRVSVIVPVLNAEETLNQVLDSLTNQTLEEMEFILADAGSTDHSLTIMKEYAEADRRFLIPDSVSANPEEAIRTGLKTAKGGFISILAQDDSAEPQLYERLYRKVSGRKADRACRGMVRRDYLKEHPDKSTELENWKRSVSYRLGRAVTCVPRKTASAVRLIREYGFRGMWEYLIRRGKQS